VRRLIVPLLALLLAGCNNGNSPQAECERQAEQDPAVQAIYSRTNGDYSKSGYEAYYDLREAKHQAALRCLRANGLAPPGGVQVVKPRIQ
jgi:hypothetical protein